MTVQPLLIRPHRRGEQGMSTAEYAVGTLGAVTVAGVLITIAKSPFFSGLLQELLGRIPGMLPGL